MSQSPLISIGITTYDRKELLIETLNSIVRNKDLDCEVIVGNDNLSRTVNSQFTGIDDHRIVYVNNQKNLGVWENTRNLYKISGGQYFTSFSDDDIFSPYFFQAVVHAIEKYDRPNCIYTNFTEDMDVFRHFDGSVKTLEMSGTHAFDLYIKQKISVMGSCGIFKKSFLESIGGVIQWKTYSYLDTFMAFYNMSHADRVFYLNAPLIYYRDHPGSLSSRVLTLDQWIVSQKEFVDRMLGLISSQCSENHDEYLYYLLGLWCMPSFFSRFNRLEGTKFANLSEYIKWLYGYYPNLHSYKSRFIIKFLGCFLKLVIKKFFLKSRY